MMGQIITQESVVIKSVPPLAVDVIQVREVAEQTAGIKENGAQGLRVSQIASQELVIRERAVQRVGVNVAINCSKEITPCVAQGAAKTFKFEDEATVDYSGATEITFDVWQNGIGGASLLSVSLSGSQITLPETNIFQFTLDNAASLALPKGRHWCEAWVTLSGGERRLVGSGWFEVQDTRKHDA